MAETLARPRVQSMAKRTGTGPSQPAAPGATSARRERLREFQSSLSERLLRAQSAPVASNRLGLQIGSSRILVDLVEAGEILVIPSITPVPLVKAWYRGIANVRGNLIGIVDLSLFAGGEATPLDQDSRVLTFGSELRFAGGILISRMLGLRNAADLQAASDDAATPSRFAPWVRARRVDAQGLHWEELELAALIRDERYLRIARF